MFNPLGLKQTSIFEQKEGDSSSLGLTRSQCGFKISIKFGVTEAWASMCMTGLE